MKTPGCLGHSWFILRWRCYLSFSRGALVFRVALIVGWILKFVAINFPLKGSLIFSDVKVRGFWMSKWSKEHQKGTWFRFLVQSLNHSSPHVRESGFRNLWNFCFWNPESRKILESGILGFGIRNAAQGMHNPTKDWNPEAMFYWQRLKSGSHGV